MFSLNVSAVVAVGREEALYWASYEVTCCRQPPCHLMIAVTVGGSRGYGTLLTQYCGLWSLDSRHHTVAIAACGQLLLSTSYNDDNQLSMVNRWPVNRFSIRKPRITSHQLFGADKEIPTNDLINNQPDIDIVHDIDIRRIAFFECDSTIMIMVTSVIICDLKILGFVDRLITWLLIMSRVLRTHFIIYRRLLRQSTFPTTLWLLRQMIHFADTCCTGLFHHHCKLLRHVLSCMYTVSIIYDNEMVQHWWLIKLVLHFYRLLQCSL